MTAPCRPQPVRNTGPIPSTPFLSTASLLPPPHLPFSLSCVLIEYFGPLFARFSPVWSLSGPDPDWNFLSDSHPRPLPQFCTPNSRRGSSPTPVLPPSCLGSPISQISLSQRNRASIEVIGLAWVDFRVFLRCRLPPIHGLRSRGAFAVPVH